jgi:NAD(P)-dependent dehydrogenase (short-subunit alcohol dehydrogenase family)
LPHPWLLVAGSSDQIGSELCSHFARLGWQVCGLDNIHSPDVARFIDAFLAAPRVTEE